MAELKRDHGGCSREHHAQWSPEPKRRRVDEAGPSTANPLSELPILPLEIITEILCRVPAKPLLKFRCVCKCWKSLIFSSDFVKKHLTLAKNDADYGRHRLILSCTRPHFVIRSCFVKSVLNRRSVVKSVKHDYPLKKRNRCDLLVGSCDGLVCIGIEQHTVLLWNPSTRVCKKLPELWSDSAGSFTVFGFGYDSLNDDYKVVRVFCHLTGGHYRNVVDVFSLRRNSWNRIEGFPYGVPFDDSGKYVCGALHWTAESSVGTGDWIIVSFNVATEKYEEVLQPTYGDVNSDMRIVVVLGGCLSVLCHYEGSRADVWVMKEYGVRTSWTRLASIPYMMIRNNGRLKFIKPICVSQDGEILLEFNSCLVVYNSKDNTVRYPDIRGVGYILEGDLYVESLVSPSLEV